MPEGVSTTAPHFVKGNTDDHLDIDCKLDVRPRHPRTYIAAALALALVSALGGAGVAVAILTTSTGHCVAPTAASVPPPPAQSIPPPSPPAQNSAPPSSPFDVDPANVRCYVNGQRRRPTDPATAQEIAAAQTLLFGSAPLTTLDAADSLWQRSDGWAAAAKVLAAAGGVDPASIEGVGKIHSESGDPSSTAAQQASRAGD